MVIFPREIAPQLYDTVLLLCREAGFSLKIAMEAHPAQSIIALVAAGVGIGFIASETQRLDRAGVTYRPIRGAGPQLSIGVAYHTDEAAPLRPDLPGRGPGGWRQHAVTAGTESFPRAGCGTIAAQRVSSLSSKIKQR